MIYESRTDISDTFEVKSKKEKLNLHISQIFFFPSASFCSRDIGDYFGFQTKKYMFVFFLKKIIFQIT